MQVKKLKVQFFFMSTALGYLMLSTGCAPVAYLDAATDLTTCAGEERSFKTVWKDSEIKVRIESQWAKYKPDLVNQVNIVVYQGQVLLTGVVDKSQTQIEAVRLVWKVPNIKQVIDETIVGQEGNFTDVAQDAWISTQLNSTIAADDKIRSSNYKVQTVGGVIYLMGIAQNKQELDKVIKYARHIEGVKKVKSHVVIKGQINSTHQTAGFKQSHPQTNRSNSSPRSATDSSANDGIVEIDTETPIIQENTVKVQSLEAPNTGSSFQ
ncbi:MAG: BON domain-containing protein [Janthinobacterium lividum]